MRALLWLENAVFVLLCVAVAGCTLVAYLVIHTIPGAPSANWYDSGVYVSWAFLIYFSWVTLPRRALPPRKRLAAWALFLLLEIGYPVLSWLLEGGDRAHLFGDLTSYFSSSLALSVGALLTWAGAKMVRRDVGMIVPLAFVGFFIVWPGLAVEWAWWQAVELQEGPLSQLLRAAGVMSGAIGIARNLFDGPLFE